MYWSSRLSHSSPHAWSLATRCWSVCCGQPLHHCNMFKTLSLVEFWSCHCYNSWLPVDYRIGLRWRSTWCYKQGFSLLCGQWVTASQTSIIFSLHSPMNKIQIVLCHRVVIWNRLPYTVLCEMHCFKHHLNTHFFSLIYLNYFLYVTSNGLVVVYYGTKLFNAMQCYWWWDMYYSYGVSDVAAGASGAAAAAAGTRSSASSPPAATSPAVHTTSSSPSGKRFSCTAGWSVHDAELAVSRLQTCCITRMLMEPQPSFCLQLSCY